MPSSNLVPKQVIDVNGKHTTVYVNPSTTGEPPRKLPPLPLPQSKMSLEYPIDTYGEYTPDKELFRYDTKTLRSRRNWLAQRSQEWIDQLTPEERRAVAQWTRNGHEVIGEYLESGYIHPRETVESIKALRDNLDSALMKWGYPLDEPIKVYRGIDSEHLTDKWNITSENIYDFIAEINDNHRHEIITGYEMPRAASLSSGVARSFAGGYFSVVLEVEVSEIQSPAVVNNLGDHEEEVFLVGDLSIIDAELVNNIVMIRCQVN